MLDEAFELAVQADLSGEVPVGAVVLHLPESRIVGRGKNEILARKDPTAHAELLAIREACAHFSSERLTDCALVSTLEPCTLCSGALIFARIAQVYFFAPVFTGAGLQSLLEQFAQRYNHRPVVFALEEERDRSTALLRSFFERKRRG